ncbi:hypothetical protein DBR27_06540 [Flavobacterium sp. HMWF030]|nr:hypothetical protein DBR27_06540 [Flavobacterium sp. HMWF030]
MVRKIIDYVVVEVVKSNHHENLFYSYTNKGKELNIFLEIKNIEDEILIKKNKKNLLEGEIKYAENLLNTVQDSTYKVTEEEILFYNEKYSNRHPLQSSCTLDQEYRAELLEIVKKNKGELNAIDRKNVLAENEIQKLKIKKSAILENNQSLDFETFRTDFEKSVLYYLEKGYEPQGGVSVSKRDYDLIYAQAMVKYEK